MRLLLILFIASIPVQSEAQHYHHGLFWFRLALADTIGPRIKTELLLQKRTQTEEPGGKNIFATPQFTSVWLWFNYTINSKMKLGISPFGYFESHILNTKPSDPKILPIKEYRWAVRLEHENKGKILNLINRYNLEYRRRDLQNNGIYQPNFRVRYMLRLEKPVKGIFSAERPVTFTLYDEVFLQFGKAVHNNPNVFDQNRVYLGANYEFIKNVKLSIGYIYGFQERNSGVEFDNINLFWTILTFDNVISQFLVRKRNKW